MSPAALPADLIQPILAYISPVLHRETWLACCLVNSNFRAEVQPRGFKFIHLPGIRHMRQERQSFQDLSQRFLALLRSSEHIRNWVHAMDIAFNLSAKTSLDVYAEVEVLRLLPSLKTLIFSGGDPTRPRSWKSLHHSLREALCQNVFPRLEHLHLSGLCSFPSRVLLSAQLLRSLHLRGIHHLLTPVTLNGEDARLLTIVELGLDRIGIQQAANPMNIFSQVTGIDKCAPRIYSLKLSFSPKMQPIDIGSCAALLRSMRGHLTKLQWAANIPPKVWPQFQVHGLLRLSQYPVLEHLVLNAPSRGLHAFIPWLVAELLGGVDKPLPFKSLSLICNWRVYSKVNSPWSALDQMQSLEYFNALMFTWKVLPAIFIFREIVEGLPLCHRQNLLRFTIPTELDDGKHIRAINQVLG
ncbi:hypothetical protein DL96DRAFT_1712485 [Flagelloscypha sp. PMI_526]|nr:hypothetical protein DL96DRAFT_1712485 [Flagelloscypha sp. PMI_526]